MKTRTITKLITVMMAVAATAVIGSSWAAGRAGAAGQVALGDGSVRFISAPIGFTTGQTLRVSAANMTSAEGGTVPARAQVVLYDAEGNPIARSREVEVPAGHFRAIDFDRAGLPVAGEPGTGRLQVRAGIQFVLLDGSVRPSKYFPVSMEVMDNRTGATTGGPYYTGYVKVSDD
jgi:hypothetical protein